MKIFPVLGLLSLAVNVALLGVLAYGSFQPKAAPARAIAVEKPALAPQAAKPDPTADAWSELSSTDLAAGRDRLLAEGFPPAALRAVLAAQLRDQFAARRKAIETNLANTPFWKNPTMDPQTQAQLRALAKEEQKALKDLLGSDPINSHAARLRREFPELTAEKIDQMAAIRERYDELRQDLYGTGFRGTLTPTERDKMTALEKAMHQEFASVLTPAELEHYDLRTSNTANSLRYTLSNFGASEAEFRALYRLQSTFDEQHRFTGGTMSQDQQRARSDAQRKLSEDIAAALGAERYADYQRASDYNFRQTSQLVSRLNLPPETATTLYAVQKNIEERRNAIYRDSTPESRSQMTQKLTVLAAEATTRVNAILGGNQTATTAYKQYGGSWLTNMVPRPAPTTGTTRLAPTPAPGR